MRISSICLLALLAAACSGSRGGAAQPAGGEDAAGAGAHDVGSEAGGEDAAPGGARDVGSDAGGVEAGGEDAAPDGACATRVVPDDYPTIQAAIDATQACDTVLVRPGTYNEQLMVPARVITVTSDPADGGNELVEYAGTFADNHGNDVEISARKPVLRRALRTILDGTGKAGGVDAVPMVDFADGVTRETVFDGFTVQHLPSTDHTIPGHAHTVECRGTSPTIRNNIIRFNGSTGVGSHATFREKEGGATVDWRQANIESIPAPLVERNVSHHNEGMGLGNHHYSQAEMRDNEVFANATLDLDHSAAGIGSRHGARPTIEGNLVYGNAWGGISVHQGVLQGRHHIDLRTSAVIRGNEVWDNGQPGVPEGNVVGIGVDGAGTPADPVVVENNLVRDSHTAGIGIRNEMSGEGYVGTDTWVWVTGNVVSGSATVGIACAGGAAGTTHCEVARNVVAGSAQAGFC